MQAASWEPTANAMGQSNLTDGCACIVEGPHVGVPPHLVALPVHPGGRLAAGAAPCDPHGSATSHLPTAFSQYPTHTHAPHAPKHNPNPAPPRDGFMVGCLAACLRFCRPFLDRPEKKQGALQASPGRAARSWCAALLHACRHAGPGSGLLTACTRQRLDGSGVQHPASVCRPPQPSLPWLPAAFGPGILPQAAAPAGGRGAGAQPGRAPAGRCPHRRLPICQPRQARRGGASLCG